MRNDVTVKNVVDFLKGQEDALRFFNVGFDVLKNNIDSVVKYSANEVTTDEFDVYMTFTDVVSGNEVFLGYITSAFVASEFLYEFEGKEFFDSYS